jgi:hypothetical protein
MFLSLSSIIISALTSLLQRAPKPSHRSGAAGLAHCGIRAATLRRIGSNRPRHVCRRRAPTLTTSPLTTIPIAPAP